MRHNSETDYCFKSKLPKCRPSAMGSTLEGFVILIPRVCSSCKSSTPKCRSRLGYSRQVRSINQRNSSEQQHQHGTHAIPCTQAQICRTVISGQPTIARIRTVYVLCLFLPALRFITFYVCAL
jgi:hypothetical protein